MPRDDTPMTLRVDKGVRAARGGNDTRDRLEAVVTIPGPHQPALLRRPHDRRRQRALRARADSAAEELVAGGRARVRRQGLGAAAAGATSAAAEGRSAARTTGATKNEIGEDILAKARRPCNVSYVPSDEGGDTSHGFKFLAPVGRYLHVLVKDGVQGTGGYLSGKPFVATVKVDPYPRALTFLGEGALLSLSGDARSDSSCATSRRWRSRSAACCRISCSISRRRCGTSRGPSSTATWRTSSSSGSSRPATTAASRRASRPTTASTSAQYLQDQDAGSRRGSSCCTSALEDRCAGDRGRADDGEPVKARRGIEDTRLILVTDLGFIVKQAKDGSRDVFVQSIRTGCRSPARASSWSAATASRRWPRRPTPPAARTCRRRHRPTRDEKSRRC